MIEELDSSFPWTIGGDPNFIECRQDKQGGTRFRHAEEDNWMELRDMEFAVGDPWILKPKCVTAASPHYTVRNKREVAPVWQKLDRFYVPVQWMPRVARAEIHVGAFKSDHYLVSLELCQTIGGGMKESEARLDFSVSKWM